MEDSKEVTTEAGSETPVKPIPRAPERVKERVVRFLFGEDIFISYARADGAPYAIALANELASRKYSCTFDQWGTDPGAELPERLKRALRRSSVLVLISTKSATKSSAVQTEIETFLKTRREIIPITLDGTIKDAIWWPLINGLYVTAEKEQATGDLANPSHVVINRIEQTFGFYKKDKRLRITTAITLCVLLVLLCSGLFAGVYAERRAVEASTHAQEANRNRQIAYTQQLAGQASRLSLRQYDLALLLNLESYNIGSRLDARTEVSLRGSLMRLLTQSPNIVCYLQGQTDESWSLAFSPDGKILASGQFGGTIRLWDVNSQQPLPSPSAIGSSISSLAFSPEGKLLAYGSIDGKISLWDITSNQSQHPTKELVETPETDSDGKRLVRSITALAFSPDNRLLASGSCGKRDGRDESLGNDCVEGEVHLWDLSTGRQILSLRGLESDITSAVFTNDGKELASASRSGVILWNLTTHKAQKLALNQGSVEVKNLRFTSSGALLAVGVRDETIIVWDISSGQMSGRPMTGFDGNIRSAALSPDGRSLATGVDNNNIILWDLSVSERLARRLGLHKYSIRGLSISPDSKILAAAGGTDDDVTLWDIYQDRQIYPTIKGYGGRGLVFGPDGKLLAFPGRNNRVIMWDVGTGQTIALSLKENQDAWRVVFNPDGQTLSAACNDGTINVWNIRTQQLLHSLAAVSAQRKGGSVPAYSVAYSPDAKLLAAGYQDGTIILWDLQTYQESGELQGKQPVSGLAFSPDGQILASGGLAGEVALWDVSNRRLIREPMTASDAFGGALAFSPDGSTLAWASQNNRVRLWDVKTSQLVGQFVGGGYGVDQGLAFSPDGKWLASSSANDHVFLWDINFPSWLSSACSIANRNLTDTEWAEYVRNMDDDDKYHETCSKIR